MDGLGTVRLALVLAGLASCGGAGVPEPVKGAETPAAASAPAQPEAKDQDVPEAEAKDRLLALFAKLITEMSHRDPSCDRFSRALSGWLAAYGDEIRDLLILDLSDSDHEEIEEAITEAATQVVFGASECGSSSAAMASYDEFDALVL